MIKTILDFIIFASENFIFVVIFICIINSLITLGGYNASRKLRKPQ